jgi:hypothetical protein
MPAPAWARFYSFIHEELCLTGHMHPIQLIKGKTNLGDAGFEGERWLHLAQDYVKWQAVVLKVLNPYVLLSSYLLISVLSFHYWHSVSSWNETGILH